MFSAIKWGNKISTTHNNFLPSQTGALPLISYSKNHILAKGSLGLHLFQVDLIPDYRFWLSVFVICILFIVMPVGGWKIFILVWLSVWLEEIALILVFGWFCLSWNWGRFHAIFVWYLSRMFLQSFFGSSPYFVKKMFLFKTTSNAT